MRTAGGSEFSEAISDQWDEEVSSEGSKLDSFLRLYELLRSKGYSDPYAEEVAIGMLEGKEPIAKDTIRFAGTYPDDPPEDIRFCGQLNK
tara:strand:+ start:57 stop:326 length:270 start_codon:yes stop_codon:yes gene_type:complete